MFQIEVVFSFYRLLYGESAVDFLPEAGDNVRGGVGFCSRPWRTSRNIFPFSASSDPPRV
jgi:hypothetical protein